MTIVVTNAGQLFRVTEPKSADLAHCWDGVEVKRVAGQFVDKKNAREMLVSKAHARVLEAA